MPSLLYVCTGNVCRSPFAERLSRHLFAEAGRTEWRVESLGTNAMSGHPMDKGMREQLEVRGGSAEGFLARQATFDRLEAADLVIAMSGQHREWVLEESPALLSRTFTLGQVVRFAADEAGAARGADFLTALRSHRSRARRRDDVPDPYRRGSDAARASADIIAGWLDVLLPRLVEA